MRYDRQTIDICSQLGHQAAQCSIGTVNWRTVYGAKALLQEPTVFPSQIYAYLKTKTVNVEEVGRDARLWAEKSRTTENPVAAPTAQMQPVRNAPGMVPAPPGREEDMGLPPGWATAKDGNGRIYYWHRETKATQWERPTWPVSSQKESVGTNGMARLGDRVPDVSAQAQQNVDAKGNSSGLQQAGRGDDEMTVDEAG